MLIGQLAQATGIGPRAIRFYEAVGLLVEPPRSEAGYRLYDEAAAQRLGFIRGARALGLSLPEIRTILVLRDRGEAPCEHVLALIETKLQEVGQQIQALEHLKGDLERLHDEGRRLPTDCSDMRDCVCDLIGGRVAAPRAPERRRASPAGLEPRR